MLLFGMIEPEFARLFVEPAEEAEEASRSKASDADRAAGPAPHGRLSRLLSRLLAALEPPPPHPLPLPAVTRASATRLRGLR